MKWRMVLGIILLILGTVLFIYDFLRMSHWLLYILAFMAFISPLLSGRKIAAYLHDSSLAKERDIRAAPTNFIYLWLFFWLFFIIIYTIASVVFSSFIKYVISYVKADYLGLIYTLVLFFGSFYFYKGKLEDRSEFVTLWGKGLEKTKKLGMDMAGKAMEKEKSFEKYL